MQYSIKKKKGTFMNKPSHFKFRQILHFVLANRRNSSTGHKYLFRSCLKLLKLSKFKKENSSPFPIHMKASSLMSISFLLIFHLCLRKLCEVIAAVQLQVGQDPLKNPPKNQGKLSPSRDGL